MYWLEYNIELNIQYILNRMKYVLISVKYLLNGILIEQNIICTE